MGSSTSAGHMQVQSFLNRNYYTIKTQKDHERMKAKQNFEKYENDKRLREFETWRSAKDSLSNFDGRSSKFSQSSSVNNFKPNINEYSKQLQTERKSSKIFRQLHDEQYVIRNKKAQLEHSKEVQLNKERK